MKAYRVPVLIAALFEGVAITLWLTKDNLFYLLNFSYIGLSLAFGLTLFIRQKPYARRIVQLLIGMYMLVYLGLICQENMQIEGFWYYLMTGTFEAATIHYAVAKIFGPLIFGRGWCGYACWSAMVFDFLPYKTPHHPRRKIGWIRYVVFILSFLFVLSLFLLHVSHIEKIMMIAFIIGNLIYYSVGIILAFVMKDNRAFCKYVCPVTVFLKPMSAHALLHITCDKTKCVACGRCRQVCPMDLDPTHGDSHCHKSECILCMACVRSCPKNAL